MNIKFIFWNRGTENPPSEVDLDVGGPAAHLGESEGRDVAPDLHGLPEDPAHLVLPHLPGKLVDPAGEQRRCQHTNTGSEGAQKDRDHQPPYLPSSPLKDRGAF